MPNGGNSTSSEALAKLLLNQVVGKWGVPLKIVSDRGPQLVGDAYQTMCRSLSIRPNASTAESPQTNGLVERTNQLVTHVMRKLLDESGKTGMNTCRLRRSPSTTRPERLLEDTHRFS